MEKPRIKIYDTQFAHTHPGSLGAGDLKFQPTSFSWYRGDDIISDFCVVTEDSFHLLPLIKEKIKIALLVESPESNPYIYEWIKKSENNEKFQYVLTLNQDLVDSNPHKFKFYFFGGCWINENDRLIHTKTKNISIVASKKTHTSGHKLRHIVISSYRDKIEGIFGGGYKFVENKIEALKDYRYHIVIENQSLNGWISEKLLDAMQTGCMPIYYGAKNVGDYFNTKGILQFSSSQELKELLPLCTEKYYMDNLEYIAENHIISKKYLLPEDFMWETFFKPLFFS